MRLPVIISLGLLLSECALVAVGLVVDRAELWSAATGFGSPPKLVAAFVAAFSAAFWLRAIAWRVLLKHRAGTFSLFAVLQTTLLANHVLPFGIREAARPLMAMRRGVPGAEAAVLEALGIPAEVQVTSSEQAI